MLGHKAQHQHNKETNRFLNQVNVIQTYMHTMAAMSNANAVAYNAIFVLCLVGIMQLVSMSVLDKQTNVKVMQPSTISRLNICFLPFSFVGLVVEEMSCLCQTLYQTIYHILLPLQSKLLSHHEHQMTNVSFRTGIQGLAFHQQSCRRCRQKSGKAQRTR